MKKLLTATMSFLSLVLVAQADVVTQAEIVLPVGTSLENLGVGSALDFGMGDDGRRVECHWCKLANDYSTETKIAQYVGGEAQGNRPKQFEGTAQTKYLSIDGPDKIYRTICANTGAKPFTAVDIEEGLYCDLLVQFCAGDTVDEVENDDKLIVWVEAHEKDGSTSEYVTNLVVRAGYISGNRADPRAYVVTKLGGAAIPAGFDFEGWHRLTVKAIREITTDFTRKAVGFVVFVDGQVASCDDPRGDAGTYIDQLNPVAKKWADQGALFPSLWSARRDEGQALTAVCFCGKGQVDDLSFTASRPSFAADTKALTVIKGDDKVATVSCNGAALAFNKDGVATVQLGTAGETTLVSITATYAKGYARGDWRYNGNVTGMSDFDLVSTGTLIVRSRSAVDVCQIGAEKFGSLDAAFASVPHGSRATVELLEDVSGEAYGAVETETEVTLDLKGHTLTGGDYKYTIGGIAYAAETVIDNFGTLTIVDSVGGGRLKVTDAAYPCIWNAGNSALTVEAGVFDGAIADGVIEARGEKPASIVLAGGSFKSADGAKFYLADCVAPGCSAAYSGGYWVVSGSPSEPIVNKASYQLAAEPVWDIPLSVNGVKTGGLNVICGANGRQYVQFLSLEVTDDEVRAQVRAAAIAPESGEIAIVFRTGFGADSATLRRTGVLVPCAADASGLITDAIVTVPRDAELSGYSQLFAVGLAPVGDDGETEE